jgi:hypothetical protein
MVVHNDQHDEMIELKDLTISDLQDVESFPNDSTTVVDELQHELLAVRQDQEQIIHEYVCRIVTIYDIFLRYSYRPWSYSLCRLTKSKTSCGVLLLVLALIASAVVFISHHTGHNDNKIILKNQGKVFMEIPVHHFIYSDITYRENL